MGHSSATAAGERRARGGDAGDIGHGLGIECGAGAVVESGGDVGVVGGRDGEKRVAGDLSVFGNWRREYGGRIDVRGSDGELE